MAGPEGGNATVSFLISLIFAPLPELSFGGSATVTEILAFPLGLKKKKERKKRGPACRGRKKPLCQTTQSSSHAWPVRTYSLFRPMQTHKEPHACQQCNWKSWAMWYLTGISLKYRVLFWWLCQLTTLSISGDFATCIQMHQHFSYLNGCSQGLMHLLQAFILKLSVQYYSSAYAFNNWKATMISSAEWHSAAHLPILRTTSP